MSIVPAASDQMGPGGGWNFGSPSVSYRRNQKGLLDSPEPAHFVASGITGLALGGLRTGGTFVAGLLHWRMHHHEQNGSSIWYRLDDLVNPPVVVDSPGVLPDLTPVGGGGPGGIPNLHRLPPSIEETGKNIENLPSRHDYDGILWYDASGTVIDYEKRRCPKGMRWSRRLRRCVDRKKFPPGFTTVPYLDR
jgi:hypothetical protein